MKKYIKSSQYIQATYSPSMPDWFKERFDDVRYRLDSKYGYHPIKWDTIQFYDDDPSGTYTPIYFLDLGYNGKIYIPGINDDASCRIDGKGTHLGTLYHKPRKFKEFVVDTKYIDLNAPENHSDRERYYDPRYDRDSRNNIHYQGQQKYKLSFADTYSWRQGYNRDKSGYRIPSPSEILKRYYSKYPKAVFKKIDVLYQRIKDLRDEIFDLSVREDYLDSIGTELVERTSEPREIGYGDIGYFLNKLEGVIADYKRVLNQATLHNSSIETFERWDTNGVYTEDQRNDNLKEMGEYSQRLNADIKRVMRKIDDIEKEIDNAKSW